MTSIVEELDAALDAAFTSITIDRQMIDEPTANWTVYDEWPDLVALEGKDWRDATQILARHPTLPVYAGDALWRATLPGYLRHLLHERKQFDDLPFQLARQMTRPTDPEGKLKFDRRTSPLTTAQRAAVRDVLEHLATVPPMEEAMSRALTTWNELSRRA